MSQYDLRAAFPLSGKQFVARNVRWTCHLAEVSDLRPEADRLSWYLVFQNDERAAGEELQTRKLEIVTTATHLLQAGFREDLSDRVVEWLLTDEVDGRLEWLDY
jgi:hypothetical protein